MPDAPGPIQQLAALLLQWLEAALALDPRLAYLVLALAMLLENLIPPIPSELIAPFAGFLVQQGRLALLPTILAATAGTVLGAWFWYGVGRWVGEARLLALLDRHGRWLGIGREEIERSRAWFQRQGIPLMVWARLIPGIRTLISVPAGLEGMAQGPFLLATAGGSLAWVSALTLAGLALGEGYGGLIAWAGPYARLCRFVLLGLGLGALSWLLWRSRHRHGSAHLPEAGTQERRSP